MDDESKKTLSAGEAFRKQFTDEEWESLEKDAKGNIFGIHLFRGDNAGILFLLRECRKLPDVPAVRR